MNSAIDYLHDELLLDQCVTSSYHKPTTTVRCNARDMESSLLLQAKKLLVIPIIMINIFLFLCVDK